jgi:hypothetical protein
VSTWNSRSLNGKETSLAELVLENNTDIVTLTETWLRGNASDLIAISELTSVLSGYMFVHEPRKHKRGGGAGMLVKGGLKFTKHDTKPYRFFECLDVSVAFKHQFIRFVTIYRPDPHPRFISEFVEEFASFLEVIVPTTKNLVLSGDFNIHMNKPNDPNVLKFTRLLETFNLVQHVMEPTHVKGHTLDLIITQDGGDLIRDITVDSSLPTDHFAVNSSINVVPNLHFKETITFRKLQSIDAEAFCRDIIYSELVLNPSDDLNTLVNQYDSCLRSILDKHAPEITRDVIVKPKTPWLTEDITKARRTRRKLERKWRKDRSEINKHVIQDSEQANH